MAFRSRKPQEEKPVQQSRDKEIEINAQMQGSLVFEDPVNLKISGRFNGTLDVRGTLTISSSAQVDADITGENIVVAGKVKGNILARKMLVLMPTAFLSGDIATQKLNIVEGAIFNGSCTMVQEDFLTIEELSRYLEIEPPAIEELAGSGKIPAIRDGDSWKFERDKIELWATSGRLS